MLGCIQPMSSPMMNRMLGFGCAETGAEATATPITATTRASHILRECLMSRLLLFASVDCTLRRRPPAGGGASLTVEREETHIARLVWRHGPPAPARGPRC